MKKQRHSQDARKNLKWKALEQYLDASAAPGYDSETCASNYENQSNKDYSLKFTVV